MPSIQVHGFDISQHAINQINPLIKDNFVLHDVRKLFPFNNKEFDLAISLNCLHNLKIDELNLSLNEIERISKKSYISVESYRNEEELFNLQCWALTCQSFYEKNEWIWIFDLFKFNGDYEFIYF